LEDRSNFEKPNQTTLKTQFPFFRFVEALLVAEKPKQTDPKIRFSFIFSLFLVQSSFHPFFVQAIVSYLFSKKLNHSTKFIID